MARVIQENNNIAAPRAFLELLASDILNLAKGEPQNAIGHIPLADLDRNM